MPESTMNSNSTKVVGPCPGRGAAPLNSLSEIHFPPLLLGKKSEKLQASSPCLLKICPPAALPQRGFADVLGHTRVVLCLTCSAQPCDRCRPPRVPLCAVPSSPIRAGPHGALRA